jgi:hypothetical protein
MKIKSIVLSFITVLALAVTASATGDHSHEKKTAGPNGGRVLTKIEPHAEFFITIERKVQITFLGDDGKAIAPAAQVVTVTAGVRTAPTKLSFVKSGDVLISDGPLPEGGNFPAVVQIKSTPDAKAVVEKFTVDFSKCGGCGYAEYACICGH